MAFGRSIGSRFGNLFKLQKKTLNDEGIQMIDEGLNISIEKSKQIKPTDETEP